jgi:glycosyltransferase involved in cell wall biosynthesis
MKIAIVCDWLVQPGGAEKVLAQLIQCYPQADLYAVIDFLPKDQRHFLQGKRVQTTFMQKLPFAKTHYRHLLPLMPLAIEQLDLSAYDVVLSTSHAVAKGVLTGPDQCHISYIYTPMRYAWDLQHQYLQETGLNKKLSGWLARYYLHKLRLWDYRSAAGVDHFVAISNFVAKRVEKTYRRQASVIHPPIDLSLYTPHHSKADYYLTAGRLVPYKRIDLIVQAFRGLPDKKLIVIGDGPDFKKIKSLAGANVTLLGYQPDEVLIKYLQRARAFIFAAEEDFGLLPLEAQATGTPVIAYGKGGALETIRDLSQAKPTGHFFHQQTIIAICQAIKTFEENAHLIMTDDCVNQAARFDAPVFREKLKQFVSQRLSC